MTGYRYTLCAVLLVFFQICMVSSVCSQNEPEDLDWIHGEWEMTYDPDGSPTEWFYFNKKRMAFFIHTAKGQLLRGTFFVRKAHNSDTRTLELYIGGRQLENHSISDDRSMITNPTGAQYTKTSDTIRSMYSKKNQNGGEQSSQPGRNSWKAVK